MPKLRRRIISLKPKYVEALQELRRIFLSDDLPEDSEIDIHRYFELSRRALGEYVTLDWMHKQEIGRLIAKIKEYLRDFSKTRPLNIIMIAQPGLGKSHFVKCLAKKMSTLGVSEVCFNMATMQSVVDLAQPIEAIRNLKVVDKLPLFFLDEIDTDPKNYSRLLPLMWDGAIHLGKQDLKLGKVVLIMAASDSNIGRVMKSARSMEMKLDGMQEDDKKLVDLLSRVNGGVVEIPQLDISNKSRDRRIDKVCLSISILKNKYPDLVTVPWALLHFIAISKFRYGVRSIVHLLDFIPGDLDSGYEYAGLTELRFDHFSLPLNKVNDLKKSSLSYHLITNEEPEDIVKIWKDISKCQILIRFEEEDEEY